MLSIAAFTLLALFRITYCTTSTKRGLVYIPSNDHPSDDTIWDSASSDLTWYYNYGPSPSAVFENNTKFQFVPMLFGAPASTSDNSFLTTVEDLINGGTNISYVLTFNEPDGTTQTGGSDVTAELAAQTWIRVVEPLRKKGVKLGAPAVTGAQTGFNWLQNFFIACDGGCTVDFIPIHWYGDFEGLASHIGQVNGTYQNISAIWVTEYADPNVNLTETQSFFNESSDYLDRLPYIERYSYFGSFRSSASNVGPNVAMLTQNGDLTDIGSFYLGGQATGNIPESSAADRATIAGSGLLFVLAIFWCLA